MGEVIHAEGMFMLRREEHIDAMKHESTLRDLAAKAAELYAGGQTMQSTRILLSIPLEDKAEFRAYLEEYLRHYNNE